MVATLFLLQTKRKDVAMLFRQSEAERIARTNGPPVNTLLSGEVLPQRKSSSEWRVIVQEGPYAGMETVLAESDAAVKAGDKLKTRVMSVTSDPGMVIRVTTRLVPLNDGMKSPGHQSEQAAFSEKAEKPSSS